MISKWEKFDLPLKEIKSILENPKLDRNRILKKQREILTLKKQRLQRLIVSMDDILKGENKMDFEIFDKSEIEDLYQDMIGGMTIEQLDVQMESVENLLLMLANQYRSDKQRREKLNGQYGSGMAEYLADAIEAFYRK